jgi:nitrogen fixation protein NifZ
MNAQKPHKFDWGQRVVAGIDLFNDGSYPQQPINALLVAHGTVGEVVQVGMHVESETPVYLVQFAGGCVVGCLEQEIALA